jgi:hypothetical protein
MLPLLRGGTWAAVIANADDCKGADERASSAQREFADLRRLGLNPAEVDLRSYF